MALWVSPGAPSSPGEEPFENYTEKIPGSIAELEMIAVPGGAFWMGSPEGEPGRLDNEGPRHPVEVGPFWISSTEITWDQYEPFFFGHTAPDLPEELRDRFDAVSRPTPPYIPHDLGWGRGSRPAMGMTHRAAMGYGEWLSALTGRHYRLPTEAEWEHACRAGSEGPYFFEEGDLEEYAWYQENSDFQTQPVGSKKPNPWGIFDMLGNLAEFCLDYYADDYSGLLSSAEARRDPKGPESGTHFVIRGGSYMDDATRLRSAARAATTEEDCLVTDPNWPKSTWWYSDCYHIGFRVVRPAR